MRYAVRHPELGARWLLTRVEPGALGGGRSTTSVVTLDVTEQETAQRRNEQLLRELSTILDSSTAGIAYLRGGQLLRCNRRFERMLALAPGAAAGATLAEVFGAALGPQPGGREALQALAEGRAFEAELTLDAPDGARQWIALSVRRAQPEGETPESVAVLSDITRLKAQQAELEALARERALAQASLRRVVETAPLAIALFDAGTLHLQQLNQTAQAFFGRPDGVAVGAPIDACCAPAQAALLAEWLRAAAAGAPAEGHEWREGGATM